MKMQMGLMTAIKPFVSRNNFGGFLAKGVLNLSYTTKWRAIGIGFFVTNLLILVLSNLPYSPLVKMISPYYSSYVAGTGQGQSWSMYSMLSPMDVKFRINAIYVGGRPQEQIVDLFQMTEREQLLGLGLYYSKNVRKAEIDSFLSYVHNHYTVTPEIIGLQIVWSTGRTTPQNTLAKTAGVKYRDVKFHTWMF